MSDISPAQIEEIYDYRDLCNVAAMYCDNKSALHEFMEVVAGEFIKRLRLDLGRGHGRVASPRPSRPYKPRWDWSKATPRLPESEWLPLRASIFRRDGLVCRYCGDTDAKFTVDHVIPVCRGGSNEPENLVTCCHPCNSSKSDRLLSEWRGRLR